MIKNFVIAINELISIIMFLRKMSRYPLQNVLDPLLVGIERNVRDPTLLCVWTADFVKVCMLHLTLQANKVMLCCMTSVIYRVKCYLVITSAGVILCTSVLS